MLARITFFRVGGLLETLKVMSTFLQKERRVLTRKRTKVSIELTHTQVFCGRLCVVRITVTKNKLYWCHGYLLVQNTDCRVGTKSVWHVITCNLTTYRASRNRFSAISFHNYWQYCGIFLTRFLIKIDLNIISSLHIIFSLGVRVGWNDVCIDFTNVIKVDVDVNKMPLLNA